MDHAITIRDVFHWMLWAGGIIGVVGIVGYILLVLLNPFSSGH